MIRKALLALGALLLSASPLLARSDDGRSANIVFIGNSITYGALHKERALTAPPAQACRWIQQQAGWDTVHYSNQGRSGKTTTDFLPRTRTYFSRVVQAADRLTSEHPDVPLLFSIMLGTNDSAQRPTNPPTSPAQYYRNMRAIIDSLLARYPQARVVLQRIIYYSPNTHTQRGTVMGQAGLERLAQYHREYARLTAHYDSIRPRQVSIGDTLAYDYFRRHHRNAMFPEEGREGTYYLHPNPERAQALGAYWAHALLRCLQEPSRQTSETQHDF